MKFATKPILLHYIIYWLRSFSINVQLYSQNHKIALLSYPMGLQGKYKRFI